MRYIHTLALRLICALLTCASFFAVSAQSGVTRFLDIPVDGSKSEMIDKIAAKGFKIHKTDKTEYLTGELDGFDVNIYVITHNGKVWRIAVVDKNPLDEIDIKTRFNCLCMRMNENPEYFSLKNQMISSSEEIGYHIHTVNKRYEAIYYQMPDPEWQNELDYELSMRLIDELPLEEIQNPTQETYQKAADMRYNLLHDDCKNRQVWFYIKAQGEKYALSMLYDNCFNVPPK